MNRFKITLLSLLTVLVLCSTILLAAPQHEIVEVIVAPDHADWQYNIGEKTKFTITVLQYGNPIKNVPVSWEIKPEKMAAISTGEETLKDGKKTVHGGSMKTAGFLRCWATATVDGKEYKGYATAAFEPLKIQPTTTLPADFKQFWDEAKAKNASIPLDAKITLLPERCTETVNVYQVNIQNYKINSRIYGILCIPKKEGTYPALLKVPGAGIRPYGGQIDMAEKGLITLEIGIHGFPVVLDRDVYNDMRFSLADGYWFYNLDDRDHYYYKRVYLGCVRAVDYLFTLSQFDGENLAVTGGSQGGALSIITTALDSRIKYLAAYYPALCDLTGYLDGRAGGWPHMFADNYKNFNVKPDKIETSKYYDVVNFARFIKVPGIYSWGFNDTTCPPTSMYSAYNVIGSAKELILAQDTGHWAYPEQYEKTNAWLVQKLLGK